MGIINLQGSNITTQVFMLWNVLGDIDVTSNFSCNTTIVESDASFPCVIICSDNSFILDTLTIQSSSARIMGELNVNNFYSRSENNSLRIYDTFLGDQWYIKSNADYIELLNTTLTDSHAVGEISFRAYTYNNNVDNGNNTHWTFIGPTEIIDVIPDTGMYDALVTITGVGFSDETTISFNGTPAIIDSYTPTEIITHVPHGSTTGTVFVDGNASLHTFTVLIPTISSITPMNGPVGTEILITGQYFYTEPVITFHDNKNATITSYSTTQIITHVPSNTSTGLVTISFDDVLYYSFLFTLGWCIVCSRNIVNVHHTAIYNSIASGGATFKSYTSNGCIDGGGNTGWIFKGYDPEEHKQNIKDPLTKFQITITDATGKSGT